MMPRKMNATRVGQKVIKRNTSNSYTVIKVGMSGLLNKSPQGYIPSMKFSTSIKTSCYLFGCGRHNHPEYQK